MAKKLRAVVICPGRGTYTKESMGQLQNLTHALEQSFIANIDRWRREKGQIAISELDAKTPFNPSIHTKGENAASLIYGCAGVDYRKIDQEKFEIVAVTGNSMGWYLALAMAQSLDEQGSFHLIDTMGSMMKQGVIGGQIIYPIVDEQWQVSNNKRQQLEEIVAEVKAKNIGQAYLSIDLGGYLVLAGDRPGLEHLLKTLPKEGDFPFQLINHAAFHTPLMQEVSRRGKSLIPLESFQSPKIPMIDGRGKIYHPKSSDVSELYSYTLGEQVCATYDFTMSVTVALRELAPDRLILLGPGHSLGGAIGQILIKNQWQGITDKQAFVQRQKESPFLLSMGIEEQRALVI